MTVNLLLKKSRKRNTFRFKFWNLISNGCSTSKKLAPQKPETIFSTRFRQKNLRFFIFRKTIRHAFTFRKRNIHRKNVVRFFAKHHVFAKNVGFASNSCIPRKLSKLTNSTRKKTRKKRQKNVEYEKLE